MHAVSGAFSFDVSQPQRERKKKVLDTTGKVELILKHYTKIPAVLWHTIEHITVGKEQNDIEDYNIGLDYSGGYNSTARQYPTYRVYVWLFDHYEQEGYDGEGERIGIRDDGKLVYGWTSHCSCFGPWERGDEEKEWKSTDKITDIEFKDIENVNWGPPFEQNVDWLYDKMIQENEWLEPYETANT